MCGVFVDRYRLLTKWCQKLWKLDALSVAAIKYQKTDTTKQANKYTTAKTLDANTKTL